MCESVLCRHTCLPEQACVAMHQACVHIHVRCVLGLTPLGSEHVSKHTHVCEYM